MPPANHKCLEYSPFTCTPVIPIKTPERRHRQALNDLGKMVSPRLKPFPMVTFWIFLRKGLFVVKMQAFKTSGGSWQLVGGKKRSAAFLALCEALVIFCSESIRCDAER